MTSPLHHNTPLIESHRIRIGDARVWLKMDALQPAGSFKIRGIGHACQHYVKEGAAKLISSSGGNAGIATAYAGYRLDVPVNVIVPENAPQIAIETMRNFGATVEVVGETWLEAHRFALSLVDDQSVLIHPFDDPILWPGHATIIDEVIEAGVTPDAVVLSVGGGGLLSGVATGLANYGLGDTGIIAVETTGAASLAAAVEAGRPVMLDSINTIANTLGAKQVSDKAFEVTQQFAVSCRLVSDRQALDGCLRFLDDYRILVEPACGAALAAVYAAQQPLLDKQNILVIVCGGMGVSMSQVDQWNTMLG